MFWLMVIAAVAGIGKLVLVAWGDKFSGAGLFGNLTGSGFIGVAVVFLVAGIFLTDREVRVWVKFKQTFVDPVIVDVLGKDSCDPADDRFCVVTWDEDGREIVVNWYDRRINAFDTYGGYELTLYESIRPQQRPTLVGLSVSEGWQLKQDGPETPG